MNKNIDNSLGKRIETIRENERLEVEEYMDFLEATKTSYYNWRNGLSYPSSKVIQKILERFPQYRAEWLVLGNGEMKKASSNSSTVAEANEVYGKPGVSKADLKNLFKKMIDEVDNL